MTRNESKQGLQKKRAALLIEIERLQREAEQREKQLPAHSVRPLPTPSHHRGKKFLIGVGKKESSDELIHEVGVN